VCDGLNPVTVHLGRVPPQVPSLKRGIGSPIVSPSEDSVTVPTVRVSDPLAYPGT